MSTENAKPSTPVHADGYPSDPPDCHLCGQAMRLNNECEWPDDSTPIMCWSCQHDVIGNLAMMTRRLTQSLKSRAINPKLVSQSIGLMEKYGVQGSILR